jgi:hypothetical protein
MYHLIDNKGKKNIPERKIKIKGNAIIMTITGEKSLYACPPLL